VTPSTIYEDLRRRDFTVNSIAMSLNRSSRGLLVDPNNGQGDLDRKELRAVSGYVFYDDPVRMLRAVRLGVRMGFTMDERTIFQFNSAAEAGMPSKITPQSLGAELRHIADEPSPGDVMKALEDQKILGLFSPALAGGKLSLAGLQKLQKMRQLIPFGVDFPVENFSIFLNCLCEKLSAAERSQLARACALSRSAVNAWQKLDGQAKKLERSLKSSKLQRPSLLYQALSDVPGDQILQLLLRSEERLVLDRIKHYLQKYLPAAQEINEKEAAAQTGLTPGTPKFRKAHEELIAQRLDSRPRKVQPTPPPEPVLAAAGGRGRLR
jgi:tRNA nucleotidyltransferase/poly(A) polymerase